MAPSVAAAEALMVPIGQWVLAQVCAFAAVAAVVACTDERDVLRLANGTASGLAAYVYAGDRALSADPLRARDEPNNRIVTSSRCQLRKRRARANGHQVSDRGRLSAAVVQAYEAAQS